jgi:hypothetical protein
MHDERTIACCKINQLRDCRSAESHSSISGCGTLSSTLKFNILGVLICSQLSSQFSRAQTARIQFTSEVTNVVGSVLSNVAVGTVITGQIGVVLAPLPPDVDASANIASYSCAGGRPGYVFQFNTGVETVTLNSTNAAGDRGVLSSIYLAQLGDPSDHVGFQEVPLLASRCIDADECVGECLYWECALFADDAIQCVAELGVSNHRFAFLI